MQSPYLENTIFVPTNPGSKVVETLPHPSFPSQANIPVEVPGPWGSWAPWLLLGRESWFIYPCYGIFLHPPAPTISIVYLS